MSHSLSDFIPQQFAISLPQAMDSHFDSRLADAQIGSDATVRTVIGLAGETFPQLDEHRSFLAAAYSSDSRSSTRSNRRRAHCCSNSHSGVRLSHCRGLIGLLSGMKVEREFQLPAATFLRPAGLALIREEMLERRQQERPKPTPLPIGTLQVILVEQPRERIPASHPGRRAVNSRIGGRRRKAAASNPPQAGQRLVRFVLTCGDDKAPMGRMESVRIRFRAEVGRRHARILVDRTLNVTLARKSVSTG